METAPLYDRTIVESLGLPMPRNGQEAEDLGRLIGAVHNGDDFVDNLPADLRESIPEADADAEYWESGNNRIVDSARIALSGLKEKCVRIPRKAWGFASLVGVEVAVQATSDGVVGVLGTAYEQVTQR